MHVLTHAVTNIKHVYITNKIDLSEFTDQQVLLWRRFIFLFFWITGPFQSIACEIRKISPNIIKTKAIPREKNKT